MRMGTVGTLRKGGKMKKKQNNVPEQDEALFSEMDLAAMLTPELLGILSTIDKDTPLGRHALLVAQGILLLIAEKISPATGLPLTIVKERNVISLFRNVPTAGVEVMRITPGQTGNA